MRLPIFGFLSPSLPLSLFRSVSASMLVNWYFHCECVKRVLVLLLYPSMSKNRISWIDKRRIKHLRTHREPYCLNYTMDEKRKVKRRKEKTFTSKSLRRLQSIFVFIESVSLHTTPSPCSPSHTQSLCVPFCHHTTYDVYSNAGWIEISSSCKKDLFSEPNICKSISMMEMRKLLLKMLAMWNQLLYNLQ